MHTRVLVGLAAAGIIGGGAYAFAATLGVTSDSLAAGSSLVAECDDAVNVTYTTAWEQAIDAYEVTAVTVEGIAVTCDGNAIQATLAELDDDALHSTVEATILAGGEHEFDVSAANVPAQLVENVHVVIDG